MSLLRSKRHFRVIGLDDLGFYEYSLRCLPTSVANVSECISAVKRHMTGFEKSMSPVTFIVLLLIGGYCNGFENYKASLSIWGDLSSRGWRGRWGQVSKNSSTTKAALSQSLSGVCLNNLKNEIHEPQMMMGLRGKFSIDSQVGAKEVDGELCGPQEMEYFWAASLGAFQAFMRETWVRRGEGDELVSPVGPTRCSGAFSRLQPVVT